MKHLLAICTIVMAASVWAAETPAPARPPAPPVTGAVLEVKNVSNFTYLRLNTRKGEVWAAVMNAQVKKGATVMIVNYTVMQNFPSKELKRTFPVILLGTLSGAAGSGPEANASGAHAPEPSILGSTHSFGGRMKGARETEEVHVPKATGPDARTVAEIMTKSAELKDQPVVVRGKVVKYNPGIMGKNWVHLRDGTGSAADDTNDMLVTTTSEAKLGDVVTAKGIVRTGKDFGAGYSYKALIEDATLQ